MTTDTAALPVPPTTLAPLVAAGLLVLLVTFGGLALWSAAVPLSSAARAHGSVVVDSNRKTIQHLEGGIIKSILVKDGDQVSKGQVLIELDDARLSADLSTLRPRTLMKAAQLARLQAERQGSDDITFPPDLIDATSEAVGAILADERSIFKKRRALLASRQAVLANEREQAEALIIGLQLRIENQQERIRLTEEERRGIESLAAKGHATKKRLLELKRALAELRSEEADLQAKLAETRKQAEYSNLEAKRVTDSFAETVETDLDKVKNERYELVERMQKISEQLKRLKIVAPVAGTVVNQSVHTIGGVVTPGAPLLEIVPGADSLVIEARVRPLDLEDLEIGMPVEVRFPGLEGKLLPRLHGELVRLSADRIEDGREGYFGARIRVADESLKSLGHYDLRPGMPVDVMLLKRSRTLVEYLLSPLQGFFAGAMRE